MKTFDQELGNFRKSLHGYCCPHPSIDAKLQLGTALKNIAIAANVVGVDHTFLLETSSRLTGLDSKRINRSEIQRLVLIAEEIEVAIQSNLIKSDTKKTGKKTTSKKPRKKSNAAKEIEQRIKAARSRGERYQKKDAIGDYMEEFPHLDLSASTLFREVKTK